MSIKVLVMAHDLSFKHKPVRGVYYLAAIPRVGETVLVTDHETGVDCQFEVNEVIYFAAPNFEEGEHPITIWGKIVARTYQE